MDVLLLRTFPATASQNSWSEVVGDGILSLSTLQNRWKINASESKKSTTIKFVMPSLGNGETNRPLFDYSCNN